MPRGEERRKVIRREADHILMEAINYTAILMDGIGAKEFDFIPKLKACKDSLKRRGRRDADRTRAALLLLCLEEIARKLHRMGLLADMPRKVKLTKIDGPEGTDFPVDIPQYGIEKGRPAVGSPYFLYKDDGTVYRTSRVNEVEKGFFRTGTSTYQREEHRLSIPDTGIE